MKKTLFLTLTIVLSLFQAKADEGMWLLPLLEKMNMAAMDSLGCRLTPDQIYSINHSSLKDAIVQFGSGCTGEMISGEGLLVTNHHCGYASIQKLSSVEHDYLKDGYWAMNRSEELPVEGLAVTFLESMTDVTSIISKAESKALKKASGSENSGTIADKARAEAIDAIVSEANEENPHCTAKVVSFYNDNVWYLIVYRQYKDIRFVGAPPSSIGKFGADTDNWMWPRHTGDFSMFRVYADKDNNPAEYSEDNIPYTPDRHLKISLKGVKEGDYTMIMGYPGRTTRFQTSPELEAQLKLNDIRIAARTVRQDIMMEDMLSDPKVKIQYASKYASSSNGWKKWKGMKIAFRKLGIIGRAEEEEEAFSNWVSENRKREARYGTALDNIASGTEGSMMANEINTITMESVGRIELALFASKMKNTVRKELRQGKDTAKALENAFSAIAPLYKDYSAKTDRKIAAAMLEFYRDNVDEGHYLTGISDDFSNMDIPAYVDSLFDSSLYTCAGKIGAAVKECRYRDLMQDPAVGLAKAISSQAISVSRNIMAGEEILEKGRKAYTAGLLEWRKGKPSYPDANFTMRLTYGTVKGYSPKDAVTYRYYTTLDGVMEKEDPDNWEFTVPEKLKELYQDNDFGHYALPDGKMPVAFLSNNDITGGNSGSPVLNADGELVGLAFDGNWESMSSDVMFEPDLQRCINVDIRYVLFIMDKFGGAGWLLDEMDIVQ